MQFGGIGMARNAGKKGDSGSSKDASVDLRKVPHNFGWDGTERRKNQRFCVNWNGTLEQVSSDIRAELEVRVTDVSEGGCCIHIKGPFGGSDRQTLMSAECPLALTLFSPKGVLTLTVEVRWHMPVGADYYAAGLQFLTLTARERSLLLSAIEELRGR
jgi:hypothetical protein